MTDLMGATDAVADQVTIPVEGKRRMPSLGPALPTERTAALMVLAALAFIALIRAAFKGALGD